MSNISKRICQTNFHFWKHIPQVFREFERQNQLILESVGEGIYGVDLEGRATFFNGAAERILGWDASEMLGRVAHSMFHYKHRNGEHYHVTMCPIYQAFKDGVKRVVEDEVFWTKEGKPIDVEYTSTPIRDGDNLVGAVVIFRDVTQKRLNQERLVSALQEVEELKHRLEIENAYLQEELRTEFNHHLIVGKSKGLQDIIQKIEMVAPTQATTLITGESGTGKELIARAIHELSHRGGRSLIKVNCAAIPADLFESEFFGHAKGAFTGAINARVGRFELADGGTLFLDEVAEIPIALQGKLLRVLQEQQFEPVGGTQTKNVDVRIIAATNKNLKMLAKHGKFREDLYFRLNVFPIESIPLRNRLDDIPLLALHFLKRAATRANKTYLRIPENEMERLGKYSWPGNIRELENIIERQVILARDNMLSFADLPQDLPDEISESKILLNSDPNEILTEGEIKNRERCNIEIALKRAGGKVSGKNGAAEILNLKPTTLSSRIKKYGIDVSAYKSKCDV